MDTRGNGALVRRRGGCAARGPRHGDAVPALSSPPTAANGTKPTMLRAWGEEGNRWVVVGGDASAIGGALETVAGDGRARQVCRNDGMESKARDCRDQLYSFRSRMEWRGGGEEGSSLQHNWLGRLVGTTSRVAGSVDGPRISNGQPEGWRSMPRTCFYRTRYFCFLAKHCWSQCIARLFAVWVCHVPGTCPFFQGEWWESKRRAFAWRRASVLSLNCISRRPAKMVAPCHTPVS